MQCKKAYNELIPDIGVSPYSDIVTDQKSCPYSQYITLKDTSWPNLKEVQRNNDLRNENLFRKSIAHYKQEPMNHVNIKGIIELFMHNQEPVIHSNEEHVKEKEDINVDRDISQLDEDLIIVTEDYECP